MNYIDEQIHKLQKLKAQQEFEEKSRKMKECQSALNSLIGKSFVDFGGVNGSGSANWGFLTIRNVESREDRITISGDQFGIHLTPAFLYRGTFFERAWSDPEYNKSVGSNSHQTRKEDLFIDAKVFGTLQLQAKKKKSYPVLKFSTIDEYPYTVYGGWMDFSSIDDFHWKWKPITEEEMKEISDLSADVQNLIWTRMMDRYSKDCKKFNTVEVLAITTEQKRLIPPYLEMLNSSLDKSGIIFDGNILEEFKEFLKTRNKK